MEGRVLVTGANSQIGHCVLRRVSDAGGSYLAMGRRDLSGFEEPSGRFLRADLSGFMPNDVPAVSALIHIAAIWLLPPHLQTFYDWGVRRLVCFSSTAIYDKVGSVNAWERDVARRMMEAEESVASQCAALGIDWTVLRPTLIYGLGMDRNISRAARFIDRFGFYPLATGAVGMRQPVHADDLASAALTALTAPAGAGQCYDVGGGERLPYREMIGRVFDTLGRTRRFVPVSGLEYAAAAAGIVLRKPELTGDVARRMRMDLVCDNDPAAQDLCYRPRDFLSGGKSDLPI